VSRESVPSYARLLWRQYSYQLPLVSASLAGLIIEATLAQRWSSWRFVPMALVAACLIYFLLSTFSVYRSLFPHPAVAYSICTGKTRDWFEFNACRQQEARLKQSGIRWDAIQREFRIHRTDWTFVYESTLSEDYRDWIELARRMLVHFWNLPKRVEGVPIYHFFLIAPPTLVFALGAHVGRKVAYVVYHFVPSTKQPYVVVADTSHRDTSKGFIGLNRRVEEKDRQYIKIALEQRALAGSKVIIVLDFTNHRFAGPFLGDMDVAEIIRIGHRDGIGHLPSAGWERLAHEIASVMLEYCDRGTQIDLYINCPLALAFLIGAIVGPVQGLTLCEYNVYLQKSVRCFDIADRLIQGLSSPTAPGRLEAVPHSSPGQS